MSQSANLTINNILQQYSAKSLNEADTRFKIIDEIITNILCWPKDNISLEVIFKSSRADYILYKKNQKPALIIESKKAGKYFDLPNNINSNNNYQKITVEKLLTDKNIKDAIFQVKEYCEDLGCNYGCISNGYVWIFFNLSSTYAPWKKQPAFVIRKLEFFSENYTLANNLFSYNNIINNASIQNNIGISRTLHSELYYPKSGITTYEMPVNSNLYSNVFNSISRKYLSAIPLDDKVFFSRCYVTNKGNYDDLQKNVRGVIFDSLTPFFLNEGFRDVSHNNQGGNIAIEIENILKRENLDNVMIIFGGRGSGKSTFIKRLLFHIKPKEIVRHAQIAVVDLISAAQVPIDLTNEIWSKVRKEIDVNNILEGPKEELLDVFSERFSLYQKQILLGLEENSADYIHLINEFIIQCLSDVKYCCLTLSRYWKNKRRGLIIVLDNLDQLRPELQDVCFLNSIEIAKKLGCLVIISMREERFFNAKSKGVLDAYQVPGFHINSPVIPDVICKRINFILEELKCPIKQKEVGIKNSKHLNIVKDFLIICVKDIKRNNSEFAKFLRYSTHGDVRQALEFFKGFLTSGYTNIMEMVSSDRAWTIKGHQIIKPMMIPSRFFYDEKHSNVPNVYQLRNDINSSHFCGLRILSKLDQRSYDKAQSGFIDARYLIQIFDSNYDLKEDCIKNLNLFLSKGVIESNNRLEEYNEYIDQIRITSFGKYILDHLCFDFTYLDLISLDCGNFNETLNNSLIKDAELEVNMFFEKRIKDRVFSRIQRVDKFITYLEEQEKLEFTDLGMSQNEIKFASKIRLKFDEQKKDIIRSLSKRNESDYSYKAINQIDQKVID